MAYFNNIMCILNNTNHIYVNVFWYYVLFVFLFLVQKTSKSSPPCVLPFPIYTSERKYLMS